MTKDDKPSKLGDINFTMGDGNEVGNVGHTVNEAPEPELKLIKTEDSVDADGVITVNFFVEVVAPYMPPNLRLVAISKSIIGMELNPLRTGMMQCGHTGKRDDHCFTNIIGPSGRYRVTVTSKERPIELQWD
ncbi:MAG: hypothetical protein Q8N51_18075, partial [Gammaproteobacteria bacterium]|nr:hypothetical protein [Gammaproteobacteria bacterium]